MKCETLVKGQACTKLYKMPDRQPEQLMQLYIKQMSAIDRPIAHSRPYTVEPTPCTDAPRTYLRTSTSTPSGSYTCRGRFGLQRHCLDTRSSRKLGLTFTTRTHQQLGYTDRQSSIAAQASFRTLAPQTLSLVRSRIWLYSVSIGNSRTSGRQVNAFAFQSLSVEQCDRWSTLMPLLTWQLWLARDLVRDFHLLQAKSSHKFNSRTSGAINVSTFS
jgi:hypothetical protein